MSMVLTSTKGMNRAEWLSWRRKGLGSSDAAAVCGLNPYHSPLAVYLEKRGEISEKDQNLRMWFGTEAEPIVAKRFELETGKRLRRRNSILQHPDYPWMIANIDREVIGERAVVELKTASEFNRSEWSDNDAPNMYKVQVLHQLAVTGFEYGYLAVIFGNGADFQWRKIERDEEMIRDLIRIEERFWKENVLAGVPPAIEAADLSTVERMHPASNGQAIDLPPTAKGLLDEYDAAKEAEKHAAKRREEIEAKIKAMLGDNEVGYVGERTVKWATVTTTRLDTKALKVDHPEIYDRYVRASVYRRFEVR